MLLKLRSVDGKSKYLQKNQGTGLAGAADALTARTKDTMGAVVHVLALYILHKGLFLKEGGVFSVVFVEGM